MATLLWILAVVLVAGGLVTLVRGSVRVGITLVLIGLLVGPAGAGVLVGRPA
jgi:hypothetical protein